MTLFDIRAPEFWNRQPLDTELRRVFDICNGCRRCLPLCPSFFENRQTVLFQIQEMIRAERIVADDHIQDEIDVYNELIPGPGELSATMMIEIEEKAQIQPELDRFMGIDSGQYVWLQIGRDFAIPGQFEVGHSKEDKIAAVHFVRFPLPPAARRAFACEPVGLVVEHPNYRARAALTTETRAALLEDLGELADPAGGDR